MGDGNGADSGRSLRALPAVHELVATLPESASPAGRLSAARRAIAERRADVAAGRSPTGDLAARAIELLEADERPVPARVLNATGVLLHTNLGRAPLAAGAQAAVAAAAAGYGALELDLETGRRGSRQAHVEGLLRELTGAEAALVVGNGAGAVLLAVAALAGPRSAEETGRGVVVSRGQLIEIGGGFRIPDVVAQSGARLVEVGTTNRTRLDDYRAALGAGVAAILRVHQSNFRTVGFVEEAPLGALCELGVPVIDDLGSGVVRRDGLPALDGEPDLRSSLRAGAAIVCCSGDKLLGGPQAGLLVGTRTAIAAAASHPLARALRIDKLSLAALHATLHLHRDPDRAVREIPVLAMLAAGEAELAARAAALRDGIGDGRCSIVTSSARVGGGALPLLELPGPAVAIDVPDPESFTGRLRRARPPVIARIDDGRVLLDPRTLTDEEAVQAAEITRAALA